MWNDSLNTSSTFLSPQLAVIHCKPSLIYLKIINKIPIKYLVQHMGSALQLIQTLPSSIRPVEYIQMS